MKEKTFNIKKYFAILLISFQNEILSWPILLGRIFFFVTLMVVFSQLWKASFESGIEVNGTSADMLWYLAFTEWIVLSIPSIYLDIEDDVKKGGYAYYLSKPINYIFIKLFEGVGQLILRLLFVGVGGALITYLITGTIPNAGFLSLFLIFIGFFSAFVLLLFLSIIGLFALWIEDVSPLFWIWQKFLFIFGGLIFPLSIYPHWFQIIASFTPFYAILYAPARLIYQCNFTTCLVAFSLLTIWLLIGFASLVKLSKLVERRIVFGGG